MPSRISKRAEKSACLSGFFGGNFQALYGAVDLLVVGKYASAQDVSGAAVGSVSGKNMRFFGELLQILQLVLVRHAQVFGQFASCIFKTKD